MKQSELALLLKGAAPAIAKLVADAVQPLVGQIAALEKALGEKAEAVSVTGAVIDRSGELVLTLSDGATKQLGVVVGKDAKGIDGLGFDDLDVVHDGERGVTLRFSRGDQVKEFAITMPIVIDRGVWSEAKEGGYAKGDGVTWAGSFWIAQKDAPGKPDTPDSGWRLAVKKGQNGKDLTR